MDGVWRERESGREGEAERKVSRARLYPRRNGGWERDGGKWSLQGQGTNNLENTVGQKSLDFHYEYYY